MHAVIATLVAYKRVIALTVLSVVLLYVIAGSLWYLAAPSRRFGSLPFRLDFNGAENQEFPNKLKFSYADIVSAPVLLAVYRKNQLDAFMSFPEFNESLFVVESNVALDEIDAVYRARLADPKLSPVDRAQMESDYQLKRRSIRNASFVLTYAATPTKTLPPSLVAKVLHDVLHEWARVAADEKGVLRYRFPMFTTAIVAPDLIASADPIVALEIVRAREAEVTKTVQELMELPGADVVRRGNTSFADVLQRLEDLNRFRVQPLRVRIMENGPIGNREQTLTFLEAQLLYNERQMQRTRREAESLAETLRLYAGATPASAAAVAPGTPPARQATETVMPQIGDSFLDRVVAMATESSDREFRKQRIEEITTAQFRGIPHEQEIDHYRQTIEQVLGIEPTRRASPEDLAAVQAELRAISSEFEVIVRDAIALYESVGRTSNSPSALYSVTGPVAMRIERPVEGKQILLYGLIVFLAALPLAAFASLLHARFREEENDQEKEDARAEPNIVPDPTT